MPCYFSEKVFLVKMISHKLAYILYILFYFQGSKSTQTQQAWICANCVGEEETHSGSCEIIFGIPTDTDV